MYMWTPRHDAFSRRPFVTPYHRNRGQGTVFSVPAIQSGWSHADLILNVQRSAIPLSLPHRMCEPLRLAATDLGERASADICTNAGKGVALSWQRPPGPSRHESPFHMNDLRLRDVSV
jgi:hypothetical protein